MKIEPGNKVGLGCTDFCVEEEEEDFMTHLFSRHLALG